MEDGFTDRVIEACCGGKQRIEGTPIELTTEIVGYELRILIIEVDVTERRRGWCTAVIEALEQAAIEPFNVAFCSIINNSLLHLLIQRGWKIPPNWGAENAVKAVYSQQRLYSNKWTERTKDVLDFIQKHELN